MDKLVSVIIPTHNRAEMLRRAIQSVLDQEYDNIEVLVIADNCKDHTAEVVDSFNDDRVIYLPQEINVGGAEARNIGLRKVRGAYIAFLDDDDQWLKGKLVRQIEVLDSDEEVAIVTCNYIISSGTSEKEKINQYSSIVLNDLLFNNYCGSFSFGLTKMEYAKNIEIDPRLKSSQDWDFWIKVLVKTGLKIKVVEECLVRYFAGHNDKLTKNAKGRALSHILFMRMHWSLFNEEQKNYMLYRLMRLKRKSNYYNFGDRAKVIKKELGLARNSNHGSKSHIYTIALKYLLLGPKGPIT